MFRLNPAYSILFYIPHLSSWIKCADKPTREAKGGSSWASMLGEDKPTPEECSVSWPGPYVLDYYYTAFLIITLILLLLRPKIPSLRIHALPPRLQNGARWEHEYRYVWPSRETMTGERLNGWNLPGLKLYSISHPSPSLFRNMIGQQSTDKVQSNRHKC